MIQDFKCTYGNSAGIREAVTNRTNLTFPDAYKHAETMAELAQVLKECDKAPFCELPFCHTVEAEANPPKARLARFQPLLLSFDKKEKIGIERSCKTTYEIPSEKYRVSW